MNLFKRFRSQSSLKHSANFQFTCLHYTSRLSPQSLSRDLRSTQHLDPIRSHRSAMHLTLLLFSLALPQLSWAEQAPEQAPMLDLYGVSIPQWDVGIEGGVPSASASVSVSDYGATPNDGQDDSQAFIDAIDALPSGGVIEVPAGVFLLQNKLSLPSGLVIRGAGIDATQLDINHSGTAIEARGSGSGNTEVTAASGYPKVTAGATKGSLSITVDDVSSFSVGGGIEVVQAYDASLHETDSRWNQSWAKRLIGHFSIVTAINGNQISLKDPVRIDMNLGLGVWATPTEYVSGVGIEELTLNRLDTSDTDMVDFQYCSNSWLRAVRSRYAAKSHVTIERSRHIEVRDSVFEYATNYGGGGHGYGIHLGQRSTGALIINNQFHHLRHSLVLQTGANGNAVLFNFSNAPYQSDGTGWIPADLSMHGHYPYSNLIESNRFVELYISDYWGPVGVDNLYLRNRIESEDVSIKDASQHQILAANRIVAGAFTLDASIDTASLIRHRNYQGATNSYDQQTGFADSQVADSVLYSEAPNLLAGYDFPTLGTDLAEDRLPAMDAFYAGQSPHSNYQPTPTAAATVTTNPPNEAPQDDSPAEEPPVEEPSTEDPIEATAPLACSIVPGSNWSSGNTVDIYLTNTSNTAISSWTVSITFSDNSTIAKVWSANWHPGTPDTATNLSWNGDLEPGETADFGFKIQKGITSADPVIPELGIDCQ
jgi:polygalacturonase